MILDLISKSRSYRRFDHNRAISRAELEALIEAARLSPSAANLQNLRFFISWEDSTNNAIFPHLKWAGYLKYWDGPAPAEQPSAYILMLSPDHCSKYHLIDTGIAAQSILLKATEMELGGCMIASMDKEAIKDALQIPEEYEICLLIAIGKPAETVVMDPVIDPDDIEYYRDANDVHHVPKRGLDELIINI